MNMNKDYSKYFKFGIISIGWIEVLLGLITIIAVSLSLLFGFSQKPLPVLWFVYITSAISLTLGIGILRYNLASYRLLIFFAKLIIISKILIFVGIIHLNGALETLIPAQVKNIVSIFYHFLMLWYLGLREVKKCFGERRNIYHV